MIVMHSSTAFKLLSRRSILTSGRRFYENMVAVTTYTTTEANASECVDMRSDTVTQPSPQMKQAMITCPLGDDVYGEDPTIIGLERRCAQLFGKEAALFVASGTMGNLISVMAHCQRGDEIIVGQTNHIHRWEQGNYAQLAGVSATTLAVDSNGMMNIQEMEQSIRVNDVHMPRTRLICLETTHNYSGGKALSLDYLKQVRELANNNNLLIHIDGARIYNAAVSLGVQVSDIAQYANSVMMCFSKGLGAPIGSIIVGSASFITQARRIRKALGGGWRQAGVLAAAASVALDNAVETINRDHKIAKYLAEALNKATPTHLKDSLYVDPEGVTNMVVLQAKNKVTPIQVQNFFKSCNVLVMAFDHYRVRIVPNWNVSEEDIQKTIETYNKFVEQL